MFCKVLVVQDAAKMVLRWATWRALGSNLVTFVESWARPLQKVTDCKTLVKHNEKTCFLQCCERSWRLSWLILALGWTMLGNLVAILEQLCDCSIGESVSLDRFGFEKIRIAKNIVRKTQCKCRFFDVLVVLLDVIWELCQAILEAS